MHMQPFVSVINLSKIISFLLIVLLPYTLSSECLVYAKEYKFKKKLKLSRVDKDDFAAAKPVLTYMGGVVLDRGQVRNSDDKEQFGGFSAIEVSSDGTQITAITDDGNVLTGKLKYDRKNKLKVVTHATWNNLSGLDESRLRQAEAIATLDGSFVISIEDKGKLLHYNSFDEPPQELTSLKDDFYNSEKDGNVNVEALTTLSDGRLLLLSEGKESNIYISLEEIKNDPFFNNKYHHKPLAARIYNPADKKWTSIRYARKGNLIPSGATTLPNGDVIVLEVFWCGDKRPRDKHDRSEHFTEIRLRRIRNDKLMNIQENELLVGEVLGHFGETKSRTIDRFEGIASRTDKVGRTFIYLISDDNWPTLGDTGQRTILIMFMLSDDL